MEECNGSPEVALRQLGLWQDKKKTSLDQVVEFFDSIQLIWRLAKDEKTDMLVPTWPVVVAKDNFRLLNTVPMEVGLQYGFHYWNSFDQNGTTKGESIIS